jgi:Integrase
MAVYKDEARGTWYVSFHYCDWTGQNKRKLKRGFRTKREAVQWEQNFKLKEAASLDMTFEAFVEEYTKDRKAKLKRSTWEIKEYIIRTRLMPYFADKKMNNIRPTDIIHWQNEMISYRDEKGKPFKPTYLKTLQAELSAIFNHAIRFYELKDNPVIKAGPLGKAKADEMLFWTKDEFIKFLYAVSNKPLSYVAFQILYWCGIREGELLALTLGDFDFSRKIMHITKSYQRIKGEDVITDPKTPKSVRDVIVPDFLCEEICSYAKEYGFTKEDRLFPVTKSYMHKEMTRGSEKSGVKRIRVHDLRHSHVSLLIHMGFSAVAIGKRVGHESQDITFRYAHMFPTEQEVMADMLNDAFQGARLQEGAL